MNQFFWYTKKEPLAPQEGDTEPKFFEGMDSFNLNKIIRSLALSNGQRLVLLDDLHERVQEIPIKNKQGRVISIKREKDAFQSEIYLNSLDSERFVKVTNPDDNLWDHIPKDLKAMHDYFEKNPKI